jgi:hypothetical protein
VGFFSLSFPFSLGVGGHRACHTAHWESVIKQVDSEELLVFLFNSMVRLVCQSGWHLSLFLVYGFITPFYFSLSFTGNTRRTIIRHSRRSSWEGSVLGLDQGLWSFFAALASKTALGCFSDGAACPAGLADWGFDASLAGWVWLRVPDKKRSAFWSGDP